MPYENKKLSEYKNFLNGKNVSVIGVGISNIPLIDFLLNAGANVTARDKKTVEKLREANGEKIDDLLNRGVKFVIGDEYLENLSGDVIFKSPGIRFDKPEIVKAYENGSIITSEMEAFLSLTPCKIIAITGSNGKTTTTTLTAEILKNAGKKVWLGGNIGKPLLSEVCEMTPEDFVVLELSSFQLHTINRFENKGLPFSHITFPDVGVVTNVSPNHLDWHTDMDEYAYSKMAVFSHMAAGGTVVLNRVSDDYSAQFAMSAAEMGRSVRTFSVHDGKKEKGASLYDGSIYIDGEKWLALSDIIIPGLHNAENYMAAILATKDFVTVDDVIKTAKTFKGVPHRLELVKEDDRGVRFYNSSIDSSPSRTEAALSCFGEEFDGRINIILGGYDKHIPFDTLAEPLCRKKCRAFITGATAELIKNAIVSSDVYKETGLEIYMCENFDAAALLAKENAKDGDVVLLSPACASFDEFLNFEKRGERFRVLVEN